ncbi:MAG: helix-turn-helix domain-containing protein [Promethearchaeota archaeon]
MGNKKECEICGREAYTLYRRKVEGVVLNVCADCRNIGEIPDEDRRKRSVTQSRKTNSDRFNSLYSGSATPKPIIRRSSKQPGKPYSAKDRFSNFKVVENAENMLQKKRIELGISSKEFASSVFIKENYYKRIEKGTTSLPIDIARKFEKKYKLTLVEVEDYEEEDDNSRYLKKKDSTGDSMVYFKKRGQKPEYD